MADDDELEDLEDELSELEDELEGLEEDPSGEAEPADEAPAEGDEGGLVDSVRDRLGGEEPGEPSEEPPEDEAPEPPEEVPEQPPEAHEAEEEPPWDREGEGWTAEGDPEGGEEAVIVRRLDADGNVIEERRGSREDLPREEPAAGGAPPPRNPEPEPAAPADEPEDDEDGRSRLVLLLVGLIILAVVGAGVAYVTLGGGGDGIGATDGPTASYTRSPTGTVATGTEISFDASGTTVPEGASATYEWSFGDDATAKGQQVTHAYTTAGTYEVQLVVTADGKQSAVTKEITVVEAPEARIAVQVNGSAVSTDNPVLNGTEVTFSGAGSTAGGTITSYTWSVAGSPASGSQVTESFPTPGAKRVELNVETNQGFTDTTTVTVGVGYRAQFSDTLPAAVTGPSQGPPHNFTVGHDGLVASVVEATLNYTTGSGGPLQDPTPAQLNVTDAADQEVASATGSDGVATVSITDAGQFVPGQWTARAAQDQGGAQKSYTLTVLVVYPTG